MPGPLPKSNPDPFQINGTHANILALHGYTGTAYDFRYLSSKLELSGIGCYAPLLNGHGENPRSINNVHKDEWIKQAEETLEVMPADKPKIIAGLSMGALIATIVAARHPEKIQGLILLAPAFRLKASGRLTVTLARFGLHHFLAAIQKSGGVCDTADPVAKRHSPAYNVIPVKGLVQLAALQKEAIAVIPKVQCPVFAAFGAIDQTVDTPGAKTFLAQFKQEVDSIELLHSHHVLPLDVDRDELAIATANFCQKVCHIS